MALKNIEIKAVYGGTAEPDALANFFIPCLAEATSYDRVAGYFSSTIFALAARGVSRLIANGGKMRLVTSHALTPKDLEALTSMGGSESAAATIIGEFIATAKDFSTPEARMKADYVKAMCWLLREGLLEIKLVVPTSSFTEGLAPSEFEKFHPKFGILRDAILDRVVFSGSVNETQLGWSGNIENLSVYKSWVPELEEYCLSYESIFDRYWNGEDLAGWTCIPLPVAIEKGLISVAPAGDCPSLEEWEPSGSAEKPEGMRQTRRYQREAVEAWEGAGRIGLLEMATGTGKTFTARQCIESASELGSLLTLVIAPYQHIADQWAQELSEREPFQVGARGNWKEDIQTLIFQAQLGLMENMTIVVVKNTAASAFFRSCLEQMRVYFDNFLLVADEVHWLGAPSLRNSLDHHANFRLGLSATPDRYFDDEGTAVLKSYFGGESIFKFDLQAALNWLQDDGTVGVLAPYVYKPIFVELTEEENEEYSKLSKRIAQASSSDAPTKADREEIERLLNLRAAIAKSAELKIPALQRVLEELGSSVDQCLIYCADFEQMGKAMKVAREAGIDSSSRITGLESGSKSDYFLGKSEREHILANFALGAHAVLFAIDCLDEGVDIPSARTGVILASSGNPKEFIQRRGRLMRRSPETGKTVATIYDMVVLQGDSKLPDSLRRIELKRVAEFAELALNRDEVARLIDFENREEISHGQSSGSL